MRCDLHCPAPAASLRGPLLALGALAALALGVYVASLLGGVLVAAIVVVYAAAITGGVVWVRRYVRLNSRVIRAQSRAPQRILQNGKVPLALPAARPAVQGVVLPQDAESRLPA